MHKTFSQVRQRGAVLITSLVILLILTLLGVSAMSTSSLEEMMAGNLRDQNLSFQAAEAALRDGERYISSWSGEPLATSTGSNNGVFLANTFGDFSYAAYNTSVWGQAAIYGANTSALPLDGVDADPVYLIEEYDFVPKDASYESLIKRKGKFFYRITARGVGASSSAVTMVQATSAIRFK